jgi:isoaspartyl peptidase/L-asparaginase-like protein (Ntn-hydrolase superfamily)
VGTDAVVAAIKIFEGDPLFNAGVIAQQGRGENSDGALNCGAQAVSFP